MPKEDGEINHYFTASPKSEMKLGILRTLLRGNQFEFLTAPSVFSKTRIDLGTRLLIESMALPAKGYLLDLGCGYGAVGIAAAFFNPQLHVTMVDVNERAIWLARQNAKINNTNNAEAKHGNLYEPVKGLIFNCILSNPPVSAGIATVKKMVYDAPEHMAEQASFQMVIKSKIAGKRFLGIFEKAFGNVGVLARKSGYRVLIAEKK